MCVWFVQSCGAHHKPCSLTFNILKAWKSNVRHSTKDFIFKISTLEVSTPKTDISWVPGLTSKLQETICPSYIPQVTQQLRWTNDGYYIELFVLPLWDRQRKGLDLHRLSSKATKDQRQLTTNQQHCRAGTSSVTEDGSIWHHSHVVMMIPGFLYFSSFFFIILRLDIPFIMFF